MNVELPPWVAEIGPLEYSANISWQRKKYVMPERERPALYLGLERLCVCGCLGGDLLLVFVCLFACFM